MSGDLAPLPQVGPWAEDKLGKLQKYLSAYTQILKNQSWAKGYVYIDALAGAGRSVLRGERAAREILDGSPVVALNLRDPFTLYVFIEKDSARVAELRKLKQEFGSSRKIKIIEGDCGDYLSELASKPAGTFRSWRGVVFLDPFGMQVPWRILSGLGDTGAFEVLVNFPVGMAIQRLLLRRWRNLSPLRRDKLDEYFGDTGWFDAVYPERETLFGLDRGKAQDAADRLVDWYRGRLKDAFGSASPPYLVCNSRGGHLYYLIWAGKNKNGLKIASYILQSGSRVKRLSDG